MSYVKIGVAGPVGSGKTALIEALTRRMAEEYSIGVITNDIYTKEDAEFLAKNIFRFQIATQRVQIYKDILTGIRTSILINATNNIVKHDGMGK